MATYVNNLRLKEITTGAESGTWGTSTNTNLELIADAFGSGTEAITTNADTHTTTVADGAADEGRAIYMKYTGTLDSACTITLAPNTINKFWIIENATSGSQNIIISQGSGANITIGNGNVSAIFTDGAGGGAAVLDALADLELSSTLTVAGASTLTGAVTMSGDASVGDDLTLVSDAAVLNFGVNSDVSLTHVHDTGLLLNSTRQLQFNDASQFINAPSATVLDINATDEIELNATAIDLNGTLDVSGTATVGGVLKTDDATDATSTTAAALQSDGGVACVKDAWIGAQLNVAGTGPHAIGSTADTRVQVNIAGAFTAASVSDRAIAVSIGTDLTGVATQTNRLTLLDVGSGVGGSITTQSATEDIAVIATAYFAEPNIADNLTGDITVASTVYIKDAPTEGEADAALYVAAGASSFFGNVGIGTNAGYSSLQVGGSKTSSSSADNDAIFSLDQTLTGASAQTNKLNGLYVNCSFVTGAGITSINAVGINTPSITETGGAVTNASTLFIEGAPSAATNNYALQVAGGESKLGGTLTVGSTSVLTGNVGIGQAAGGQALSILDTTGDEWLADFNHSHASNPFGIRLRFSGATPNDDTEQFMLFSDASATRAVIYSNGGLANYSANNVNLASDERLKDKHGLTASTWDATKAMEVWDFTYKENPAGRMLIGVMAQRMQEVAPRCFAETTREDGFYGLHEYDIQMHTLRTLQEAQSRIETLEAALTELQGV